MESKEYQGFVACEKIAWDEIRCPYPGNKVRAKALVYRARKCYQEMTPKEKLRGTVLQDLNLLEEELNMEITK